MNMEWHLTAIALTTSFTLFRIYQLFLYRHTNISAVIALCALATQPIIQALLVLHHHLSWMPLILASIILVTIELLSRFFISLSGLQKIGISEIIEQLPANIYWKTCEGQYAGSNYNNYQFMGFSSQYDCRGKTDYDVFSKEFADDIKVKDLDVIRNKRYMHFEEIGPRNKELESIYLSHKKPLLDHRGHVVGLLGVSIDITNAKKDSQTKLSLLENVIAIMPGSVYWMNKQGIYLGCNENTRRIAGLRSRHDIVGKRNIDLPRLASKDLLDCTNEKVMSTGQTLTVEEPATLEDGTEVVTLSTKTPLHNENHEVVGMVGISIDITDRKKMEEELRTTKNKLEQANIAKSEFIANMSHDLRTPITCIIGMAENLCKTRNLNDREQYAQLLTQSCNELLNLLNDFINVAQVEGGTGTVTYKRFALHEVFDSCIRLAVPLASEKKLQLLMEYDMDVPNWVIGDPHRIGKILNNLLSNAVKFTDKGTVKASVSVAKHTGRQVILSFSVADTGIGIPEDKQEIIFTRFSRLSSAYQGIYKGTGIGLSIVRQFIDDLGGDVEVKSQTGKGSKFVCHIPFTQPLLDGNEANVETTEKRLVCCDAALTYTKNRTPQKSQRRQRQTNDSTPSTYVLLVEDNFVAQTIAKDKLIEVGCRVDVVDTGEGAVEKATANHYNMIFMDIGLPGEIDGCEATRRIREFDQKHNRYTPIIALTAHVEESYRQRCLDVGMNGILHKPLTSALAREAIEAHVERWGDENE